MEMEFQDTGRRRRLLLLAVGVALALVAGWTAYSLGTRGTAEPEVIKQPVLVAARDIPAREAITADDVIIREVPVDELLGAAYADPSQVVGRITSVLIYANQQLTPNLFASTAVGSDFSILEPDEQVTPDSPHWRAVSLHIPSARAVGGEIKDGNHVDLFISVDIEVFAVDAEGNFQRVDTADANGLQGGKTTKVSFQDLEILKADPDTGLYVIKVDLHQAEQIAHVLQVAPDAFSLALRPDEDTRLVDHRDYGTTTDSLIMTYYFRVPQMVDLLELIEQNGQLTSPPPTPAPQAPGESPTPAPAEPSATPGESPAPSPAP